MDKDVALTLRVSKSLLTKLDDLSEQEGRSRGNLVRRILEQYFNAIEQRTKKGKRR